VACHISLLAGDDASSHLEGSIIAGYFPATLRIQDRLPHNIDSLSTERLLLLLLLTLGRYIPEGV